MKRKIGKLAFAAAVAFIAGGAAAAGEVTVTPDDVRAEFLHAYNAYKEFAWGHDALKPLSGGSRDWYDRTLLMTPVDAFDTMMIMGLDGEARQTKELILGRLSFDHDMQVQHFEVSIRILGGLLSAYQLDGDRKFLVLARDLADRMMPVFDSRTGMPYRFVNLKTGKTSGRLSNPAEIGTYLLEYGTLSKLTGDPVYYDKAKKAALALYERRSKIGLVGALIDVDTGLWIVRDSSIGGGTDSYYEYLYKSWRLFGDEDCRRMWEESVEAVNKYLADESGEGLWYGRATMSGGRRTATTFGALDAFLPGLFCLSGDRDRAARLMTSCDRMWDLAGIEPELMDYRRMKVVYPPYPLRPEIVESAYYLYHFTGDEKYREMGAKYFRAVVEYCRVERGYAALSDVRTKEKDDAMESFFLAETMKYFYLLFSPPDTLDLDRVVFNTEAHPLTRTW